ncbi:hypothetical protein [Rhodococcoides fascians]|uniref:hypothetical protein n=1 Tax=Rhodococcoides fascians TaxID=1828 RepID=UPI00278A92BE|nr:hypothetical protein [Rhodococcus fascians]MDQ0281812.1 hypothetical protein [Rhodococcus fascians]
MTWTVRSTSDTGRWLTHDDDSWTADPETTAVLPQDRYAFPLTPTGPVSQIVDESTLMAAAMNLLPGATATGDRPPYPAVPSVPGAIY